MKDSSLAAVGGVDGRSDQKTEAGHVKTPEARLAPTAMIRKIGVPICRGCGHAKVQSGDRFICGTAGCQPGCVLCTV